MAVPASSTTVGAYEARTHFSELLARVEQGLNRLERETALVPPHWFLEVTNVLSMAENDDG